MEADLRIVSDLRNQIERGRTNFKKLNKESMTESYVVARLEGLEEILKRFSNRHESIIATYESSDLEKCGYLKNDIFSSGYETYLSYKSELNASLSSRSRFANLDAHASYSNKDALVKLPKISIPVFSGNYVEWLSFKDLFVSLIHNNCALDDVQRLHYLKTQLSGEAEQLIKHIPITQANYAKCWKSLQDRYDNKRFMLDCIFKRLFNQRVIANESASGLKSLLDTTSDCMHELRNLGIDVDSWDLIIIYIVSLKLDAETRKQWELHINNNLNQDFPTFIHLKEFLERRFRALEFVEHAKTKSTHNNNLKAFHTTLDETCPRCTEHHKIFSFKNFTQEDDKRHHDTAKSLGFCCKCLGKYKRKYRVPTPSRFGNSTTKVCPDTIAIARETTKINQNGKLTQSEFVCVYEANNIISNPFAMGPVASQTLLATALIKTKTERGSPQILKALLDQGSEASFIAEETVQLLQLKRVASKGCISGLGGSENDSTSSYVILKLQSLHDPNFILQVKAYVLNNITTVLPKQEFVLPHWAELGQMALADPQYNSPNKISVLLGAEVYCSILRKGLIKHPMESIIAQDTHLGWVLSGQISNAHYTNQSEQEESMKSICNKHVNQLNNKRKFKYGEMECKNLVKGSMEPKDFEKKTKEFISLGRRDEFSNKSERLEESVKVIGKTNNFPLDVGRVKCKKKYRSFGTNGHLSDLFGNDSIVTRVRSKHSDMPRPPVV